MKPKTKKIIIIAAAIAAVAIILYLVFRKSGTKSIIDKLGLTADLRGQLESVVAEIETYASTHPTGSNDWSKQGLEKKAAERGVSYEKQVIIEAAYNLFSLSKITWSEYAAIESLITSI